MHLECIIPLLAKEGEMLRDPRLELIVTGYCQLQEHDLKLVCFTDCAEENVDKDLQKEEHQNQERPLPLVDITECSETNDGYEVVDGVPMRRPESVNSFLSPKFSPEPSLSDSEKQPMDVATKSDSGSMSERSSNCAERDYLVNMEGDLLVNGHPRTPPCDVTVLHEPISTGSHIHERENNRHVNGTVHMNGFGHIRKAQRTNGVVSWLSHCDVPFSSDTGRNHPCERGAWPGRVIPLNPVTEDTLQDPRLASPKSRPRVEGRFVLTPIDIERSQGENVACRQEYGNESNSQFSPAGGPPPFLDTSCHESNVAFARAKSLEDPTEDVVEIKQEPQEIDTVEERPECESELSRAQIEQWLAANRRLWDHNFMQSPQVPSEPLPSVYSPSSVLSPLYSPDILSSSPPVPSGGGEPPVQVTCPESEGQAPPEKDSGQAQAAQIRQPGCQNSEPTPVGPELPQAGYLGYHSQHFTPWPMWTYWFPLQPPLSQVPLEPQSLSVAATQMPSFSVAANMEHSSARDAPVMWTSEQTLAQSLNEQAPSVSAYPWALQPSTQAQVGSVPRNPEWHSGVPLFLPPQREEVSFSTSVPQQQQLHESCLPTPAQPSHGLSQLPQYDEPTSFAPPAAQSLVAPQALATDAAYPQAQPESDMPMESQVIESSYVYGETPPKPILESDSQATLQEVPIDSEQMQLQSGSQLESSLAPPGDHSWKYSEVETEVESEYEEQMVTWPEYSSEQHDENMQNEFPPQGVDYGYSSSEQEGENWYSNQYLQQDTESAITERDPAEGSEMQPSLETQHTSLLPHKTPLECSEGPQEAQSAFYLQMAPQEHSSVSVQTQLGEGFQSFPLQETPESTGSYTYSQLVASATAQSSESHLVVHPDVHQHGESTPAVCTAPAKEPHFLQPTVQGQGEMRPSAPLPCTAAATGTCVQGPVSLSIPCSHPYTVPQEGQCWPAHVMYPVPMGQPVVPYIQSSQLSPLGSGVITAPQSSVWQLPAMNYQAQPPSTIGTSLGMTALPCPQGFPWQLPAMNCQAQPPWTTGTSPGVTALPGPGVPANGAGSFLATFQSQTPHPAPAMPFMPPLPASPPPSKPPLPSVPPPPKSPPPPVSPPPNPPTHEPPLPSSAPRSTPPWSQESPCSSPLQSPQRKENRSRCRSSKYPIWAPSDTKYYREEYHGPKHSGSTSSRSSRSTR